MECFHKLLSYQNTSLATAKGSDKTSPVDAVKAAVCQNINLLVNRDEEEFSKFLQVIVQDVWTQLMTVTAAANQVLRPLQHLLSPGYQEDTLQILWSLFQLQKIGCQDVIHA